MRRFQGRLVLMDIEGTTSSLAFVHEVLFPFARREVAAFLNRRGAEPAVTAALDQMARDAGYADRAEWCPAGLVGEEQIAWWVERVWALMDLDAKQAGLKQLQGLIWEEGYRDGRLRSHVYPDVSPAWERWRAAGLDLRIYSSGSVAAQRTFFAHTPVGDLTRFLAGHYDTGVGGKRVPASYAAIAADAGLEPGLILFLSDVAEELEAAAAAGLKTGLVVRPGNLPTTNQRHPRLESFDELTCDRADAASWSVAAN